MFEANAAFHGAILEAAHSERLAQALASTSDDGLVFQAFRHYEPANMARSALFHEMVGGAVRQGDAARAGRLMYEHVLQGKDLLVGVVGDAADRRPPLRRPLSFSRRWCGTAGRRCRRGW